MQGVPPCHGDSDFPDRLIPLLARQCERKVKAEIQQVESSLNLDLSLNLQQPAHSDRFPFAPAISSAAVSRTFFVMVGPLSILAISSSRPIPLSTLTDVDVR